MKHKLIKLSDTHYVIAEDTKVEVGDHGVGYAEGIREVGAGWYVFKNDGSSVSKLNSICENTFKITHSTLPLEGLSLNIAIGAPPIIGYDKIKELPLSEVEEIIYGYSVKKINRYTNLDRIEDKKVKYNLNIRKEGFDEGFNAHRELVKDKLFTADDMEKALISAFADSYCEDGLLTGKSPAAATAWIKNYIKSLLPKTEFDIIFDETGKIKL